MRKFQPTQLRMDSTAATNSTFAIGVVSCSADSSVLRINICAEKPAHRKSAKRWVQAYRTDRTEYIKNKYKLEITKEYFCESKNG